MPTETAPSSGRTKGGRPSLLITDRDLALWSEGRHYGAYEKLGAHPTSSGGTSGTHFAVWAPNARGVSVIGTFNDWAKGASPLEKLGDSGIWAGFVPGVEKGAVYKYHIDSLAPGFDGDKADPFAFHAETPPQTASVVWDLSYNWRDVRWMKKRKTTDQREGPMSIYEVHLGSWQRPSGGKDDFHTYRDLAGPLCEYVKALGFTHVELLPVMEHPYYGSWGYQITGYFAATSRYGTPQDLMYLIEFLHRNGIGVILDWVPSHFSTDGHGLCFFDGTHLYEHADPRKGFHPDWGSFIFNYGRNGVRSFLISNALFWLDKFHADGLRVDAVASMLYLDYSRKNGEWDPNEKGGRENLEAIAFLEDLNREVGRRFPDAVTIAEESTAWPGVCAPVDHGGLGFSMKWDMGWMHDTLSFLHRDPLVRNHHHEQLTFRMMYAFSENYILPLSHDEVVHGKSALVGKMHGDEKGKFANLRCLFGLMYAQSGKKLLFMGDEFGQWTEWNHETGLDWNVAHHPPHAGLQRWVRDLNRLYRKRPELQHDFSGHGFEWIEADDRTNSVISFLRKPAEGSGAVLVACNLGSYDHASYRVGVPWKRTWRELLSSDAEEYWGSGRRNAAGGIKAGNVPMHGHDQSIEIVLPPFTVVFLAPAQRPRQR